MVQPHTGIRDDQWVKRSGSKTFAKKLTSIQRLAAIRIAGALRSTRGDALGVHADLWPIRLLADKVCYRSTIRLCTLDEEHPLHRHIQRAVKHQVKSHPSPLHTLFATYHLRPDDIETIHTYSHDMKWTRQFTDRIEENREKAIKYTNTVIRSTRNTVYTDGSANQDGVGAAVILYINGARTNTIRYHLGPTTHYGDYEAEVVVLRLGAHLLANEREIRRGTTKYGTTGGKDGDKRTKPTTHHHQQHHRHHRHRQPSHHQSHKIQQIKTSTTSIDRNPRRDGGAYEEDTMMGSQQDGGGGMDSGTQRASGQRSGGRRGEDKEYASANSGTQCIGERGGVLTKA